MTRQLFRIGDIVKHFKHEFNPEGTTYLYRIMGHAIHSETGERYVVYQGLYAPFETYICPAEMFYSRVDKEKYPMVNQVYRFEKWTEEL